MSKMSAIYQIYIQFHNRHRENIEDWIKYTCANETSKANELENVICKREGKYRQTNAVRGKPPQLKKHYKYCPECRSTYLKVRSFDSCPIVQSTVSSVSSKPTILKIADESSYVVNKYMELIEYYVKKIQTFPNNLREKLILNESNTLTLGKTKFGNISVSTKNYPELFSLLKLLMSVVHPTFRFTSIAVNKNTVFNPHKDKNVKTTTSVIFGLGSWDTGGDLWIEDYGLYAVKNQFIEFNASKLTHATMPFAGGDRYTFVYYSCNIEEK